MSLASGVLFLVWVSIVVVAIGGWAFKTISTQDTQIELDWQDDDLEGVE